MKRLSIYMLAAGMAALSTSCSDFLDTVPKDQLAPSTTRNLGESHQFVWIR